MSDAERALRWATIGDFSKARRAATNDGVTVLPVTQAVIDAVINPSMLKRGESEPPRPPAVKKKKKDIKVVHSAGDARLAQRRALRAAFRTRMRNPGRDVDGLSWQSLGAACHIPGDATCGGFDDLLTIIEGVRAGMYMLPELRGLVRCRGIVLSKPGHTNDNISGRLIGVPPIFLRIAATLDHARVLERLGLAGAQDNLGATQFAVGQPAGAGGVAILMQGLFDGGRISDENDVAHSQPQPRADAAQPDADASQPDAPQRRADPPRVIISADIKKAFHSLFQSKLLQLVKLKAPELSYYVDTVYAQPCPIEFMRDGAEPLRMVVERGVLPGCPVGTLIMCLVLHEHVGSKLVEEFRDVVLALFADDHTADVPLEQFEAFFARLSELLEGIGCELQPAKSSALLRGGTDADRAAFVQLMAKLNIAPATDGGLIVCGFPIGSSAYRRTWAEGLADKVISQQTAIASIALQLPAYTGHPRLQAVMGTVRLTAAASFTWAARGVAPDILEPAARRVDEELFRLVLGVLSLRERYDRLSAQERAYAETRFNLSTRKGGLALGGCVAALRGGYLGGLIDLARSLKTFYNTFLLSNLVRGADAVLQEVRRDCGEGAKLAGYENIDEIVEGRRKGKAIQHDATCAYNNIVFKRLVETWGRESNRTACLIASQGKASAALRAGARLLESRLTDAEMRTNYALMMCLPQTERGPDRPCTCGTAAEANPQEGLHAFLCQRDSQRQNGATDSAAALVAVLQALPGITPYGRRFVNRINYRPDEPSFEHARQHAGAELIDEGDQPVAEDAEARRRRRFDTAYRTRNGVWRYVDFKKMAVITNTNLQEACRRQGVAVEKGDKGKFNSYRKSISNLDALCKGGLVHFASSDYCGTISKGYDGLLKTIAWDAYPGEFPRGVDVDGLRSMCVARLRVAVGAGIWRANHKTLGAWAERAYPEGHLIDNNEGAAAA